MSNSTCRRCDAEIQFAETASGKSMPLDMVPVAFDQKGAQVVYEGVGGRAHCRPYEKAVEDVALRNGWSTARARDHIDATCEAFVSHFSTCPFAGEFRR